MNRSLLRRQSIKSHTTHTQSKSITDSDFSDEDCRAGSSTVHKAVKHRDRQRLHYIDRARPATTLYRVDRPRCIRARGGPAVASSRVGSTLDVGAEPSDSSCAAVRCRSGASAVRVVLETVVPCCSVLMCSVSIGSASHRLAVRHGERSWIAECPPHELRICGS